MSSKFCVNDFNNYSSLKHFALSLEQWNNTNERIINLIEKEFGCSWDEIIIKKRNKLLLKGE